MARKGVRQLRESIENSVKIRCRYCDIKNTCKRRAMKESYENDGIVTRCTITPNRPGKKKR